MNQVAEKKSAGLPTNMFEEDAAKGLGKIGQEDLALPFLKILGQLSPEVNKRDGKYVEGAEPGMIYNSVSGDLYDGVKGIDVIPCFYKLEYIEWKDRGEGLGAPVAIYDSSSDIMGPFPTILAVESISELGKAPIEKEDGTQTKPARYQRVDIENNVDTEIKELSFPIREVNPRQIARTRAYWGSRYYPQDFTAFTTIQNSTVQTGIPWPPYSCLLYTSPSPRDRTRSRMPSSA